MKKFRFKSILALLVALMMLLSACANGGADPAPTPAGDDNGEMGQEETADLPADLPEGWGSMGLTSGGVPISDPGQFPIVANRGDIELEIMVTGHPMIIDWNTHEMTQWMEEKTNIVINWRVIPLEGRDDTLPLELASANYPDAFMSVGFTEDLVSRFGETEGRLLAITDLITTHAPNLMQILDDFPNYRGVMTMLNGEIYLMPTVNQCFHCQMHYKMWINEEHLNAVGMDIPTTLDEFVEVLTAFRDQIPDSIPFAGTFVSGWGGTIDYYIMNSFTFYTARTYSDHGGAWQTLGLYVVDGEVRVPWGLEETREGLRFLNMLVEEGLLHEGSLSSDSDQLIALVESGDTPRVGVVTGGHGMIFSDINGERYPLYIPMLPMEGPTGLRQIPRNLNDLGFNGFFVSADTEFAEAAIKWADSLYSFEASMRSTFGPYGTHWEWAQDGDLGLDGEPAIYRMLVPWQETEPQNDHWIQQNISRRDAAFRAGEAVDPDVWIRSPAGLEPWLHQATLAMLPYSNNENFFPLVKFSAEETSEMSVPLTDVTSIIRQWIPGFIAGTFDLDTQWDEFNNALEDAGLSDLVARYQAAYDLLFGE